LKRMTRVILTLSLTAILLGATASTASATRTLSPTSVDYGNRQIGTTSPAQAFTLRVKCTRLIFTSAKCLRDTFSPSISVSGDFTQTNDCPPTMTDGPDDGFPEGMACTINVTFTPTSTGPKQGTLSTGTGGPTAALAGNGVTFPTPPTPPTPGAAPPTCKGLQATIVGTDGKDVRIGSPGPDVIVGLGGNDTLSGLGGTDVICGGPGKDNLKGGADQDALLGQKGRDTLKGGSGADLCKGGKGNDTASKCEVEKSI
jgi:RTX calcium-binding nonapeptide repeat (4 copies)